MKVTLRFFKEQTLFFFHKFAGCFWNKVEYKFEFHLRTVVVVVNVVMAVVAVVASKRKKGALMSEYGFLVHREWFFICNKLEPKSTVLTFFIKNFPKNDYK